MHKNFIKGGSAIYYGVKVKILQCNRDTATVVSPHEKNPFAVHYSLLTPVEDGSVTKNKESSTNNNNHGKNQKKQRKNKPAHCQAHS